MLSRLLAVTYSQTNFTPHKNVSTIRLGITCSIRLVFINNFSGALFYWRFDKHNVRMWTIDLWSELYLEMVSIEATKIATYF